MRGADFRDTNLTGARFVSTNLEAVEWEGATCPDGTIATSGEGCEGHLAGALAGENARDMARWMGSAYLACRLFNDATGQCLHGDRLDDAWLRARGDDQLVMQFMGESRTFDRNGPASWISTDGGVELTGVRTPDDELLVFGSNGQGEKLWFSRVPEHERYRWYLRRMNLGAFLG
jgi:hypothetical protein